MDQKDRNLYLQVDPKAVVRIQGHRAVDHLDHLDHQVLRVRQVQVVLAALAVLQAAADQDVNVKIG